MSSDGRYAWDGCNGYGNPIELINEYLNSINSVCERVSSALLKDNNKVYEQLKKAYKEILNLQKQNNEQTVKYFGPVYILTLIYFFQKESFLFMINMLTRRLRLYSSMLTQKTLLLKLLSIKMILTKS